MRLRRGRLTGAVADFAEARALVPRHYEAYLDLAQAHHLQKRFEDAGRQLKEARDRHAPPARLAQYFLECGQDGEAVAACAQALKERPGDRILVQWQARALQRLGRDREAAAAWDSYLRLDAKPDADVFRLRGQTRVKLGNFVGAAEDYTRALDKQPDADLYSHRGWAYFFANSMPPALRDFEAALRLDQHQTDAYVGRGLTRVMLGNYQAAVADADEALRRGPTTPEMMHNVACTFALAAGRAANDATTRDGQKLAATWRAWAVETVGKALAMVPLAERARFWHDKVLPDRALDAIREEPAFRRLGKGL
jgi:tetratricopeptide (TPR) repeat protein